jgi:glycine/D-amino acid oxidase-like deaminating enzyme
LISLAPLEHPNRLAAALGEDKAQHLFAYSRENGVLASREEHVTVTGGLHAAGVPGEAEDIHASISLLERWGIPAETWDADQVTQKTGAHGFDVARHFPEEAICDPLKLTESIARGAMEAGASLHTGCEVESIDDTAQGLVARVGNQSLQADTVVYAAGPSLPDLDPSLDHLLSPVRRQTLCLLGGEGAPRIPIRAQHGHLLLRSLEGGSVAASGCRWATPHMEVGEQDDSARVPTIDERLGDAIQRHIPGTEGAPPQSAWAGIMCHTCDGLPMIGPLPGRSRHILCTGFNGHELAFALRAAHSVALGLLHGRDPDLPAFLQPSRFVG